MVNAGSCLAVYLSVMQMVIILYLQRGLVRERGGGVSWFLLTLVCFLHTDELIQAIRNDIAIATKKLDDPGMQALQIKLEEFLSTKNKA